MCKRDKWPAVVLPRQPDLAYRFSTVTELLDWLRGKKVCFETLRFASIITRLFTQNSCYSTSDCFAVTEDGSVYYWSKFGTSGHAEEMNLSEALARPSSSIPTTSLAITNEESAIQFHESDSAGDLKRSKRHENYFGKFNLSAISKVDVGVSIDAAVTKDGRLHVLSPRGRHGKSDSGHAHLLDLYDGTPEHRLPLPYMVREASISRNRDMSNQEAAFIDVAVDENYVVALQADGWVFTAGDAFHGQLSGRDNSTWKRKNPRPSSWTGISLSSVTSGRRSAWAGLKVKQEEGELLRLLLRRQILYSYSILISR